MNNPSSAKEPSSANTRGIRGSRAHQDDWSSAVSAIRHLLRAPDCMLAQYASTCQSQAGFGPRPRSRTREPLRAVTTAGGASFGAAVVLFEP